MPKRFQLLLLLTIPVVLAFTLFHPITLAMGIVSLVSTEEINENTSNGPPLSGTDFYGISLANIGDLNGDAVDDIAVGADGAFYIHFMNTDASMDSTVKIDGTTANGPTLSISGDNYGNSIANIGDLNGDGVTDIAVGAPADNTDIGAVYIHFMNTDGSMDSTVKIDGTTVNGPTLAAEDNYGTSIANIGDLNGDGVNDIAVGEYLSEGAFYIHFMNTDGSMDASVKIDGTTLNGATLVALDTYGRAIANLGDLNGDGVNDIAVGAPGDNSSMGAFYIHFMNTDGSMDSTVKIGGATINGASLNDDNLYGNSIANIGDLNGDGVNDIASGTSGPTRSTTALFIHLMNRDGSLELTGKIDKSTENGPITMGA
ncbi:MAG: FG-GAP-like repeat-containing protein, partial [Pedobacter sp.]